MWCTRARILCIACKETQTFSAAKPLRAPYLQTLHHAARVIDTDTDTIQSQTQTHLSEASCGVPVESVSNNFEFSLFPSLYYSNICLRSVHGGLACAVMPERDLECTTTVSCFQAALRAEPLGCHGASCASKTTHMPLPTPPP